ncbi:MAG TPA: GNAT family N-acetyltransferase [Burkholderiaceae bacterium]|nr:GNAT family N-acetyltransferase [Burkholderiaceae bacterium]
MSRFVSEALGKHDRKGFASGNERIDTYFRQRVTQDVRRNYAKAFVLVERDSGVTAGFYTLSSHSIVLADLAESLVAGLPRYPSVPVVLIGWMGRDQRFRGQGIGTLLLADALRRLKDAPTGAHAICADAIDDAAAAFYREHQFKPVSPHQPMRFYVPVGTVAQLFE